MYGFCRRIYGNEDKLSSMLQHAIKKNYLPPHNPIMMAFDLNRIQSRCTALKSSFAQKGLQDENVLHTFAVKAMQIPRILDIFNNENIGMECASFGEVAIALNNLDVTPSNIVFDSPCKTYPELEYCLKTGISMNIDNFTELDRIRDIIKTNRYKYNDLPNIGIRVNPVIGSGDIDYLSVSTPYSKFGINLDEDYERLVDIYQDPDYNKWLNAIHCHVGSQGTSVEMMSDGIQKLVNFTETVNKSRQYINTIDIGGGMSINYENDNDSPKYDDLVSLLHKKSPVLFSNKYKIVTEYGRSLIGKSGYIVSKVEYVKKRNDKYVVTTHCGANLLLRAAYTPDAIQHYISVYDKDGNIKEPTGEETYNCDIVGPLCFAGDVICKDIKFPFIIEEGDHVIIHDCGTSSINMYSVHNSRPMPAVYGYEFDEDNMSINGEMQLLYGGQSYQDIATFWDSDIEQPIPSNINPVPIPFIYAPEFAQNKYIQCQS